MLLEFRVANYRSIGEEQVLSFVPAPKQREYPENILSAAKYNLLNAIGIYGNNASGKSNLLLSISLLDKLVHLSARTSSTTPLPFDPFLLREGWTEKPTRLEISFILEANRYRYGLEFNKNEVLHEWLYRKGTGREVELFERKNDVIDVSSGFNGSPKLIDAAIEATRNNALFLSICDMLNISEAKSIFGWFRKLNMFNGLNTEELMIDTASLLDVDPYKELIRNYFLHLNIGIEDFAMVTKEFDPADLPPGLSENQRNAWIERLQGKKGFNIMAAHRYYDRGGQPTEAKINWMLDKNESSGTTKAFQISGPIFWTLVNGGVLIIDEIEAKLHPLMTLDIINLFLNKDTNPNQAQLIFATHDTNLLSSSKLRRDQIYFAKKNRWESTEIYSLSDIFYAGSNDPEKLEKERPDRDKEKRYMEGRYEAVPEFGTLDPIKPLLQKWHERAN
ncbi:MAG TPA: ATP-binding protein [Puia sp.]|uniref:AAA family ATPase n=1 Tax=Puia sp. TaxID=2045100 RepID=UPI002CC8B052|nr:ATP-binding protein [Puia sp.]HVU95287.1 ATP-binding protein [Puia sp.]